VLFHDYFGATSGIAVLLFVCAVAALLPPLETWPRSSGSAAGQGSRGGAVTAWWNQRGVSLPSVALPLVALPAFLLALESVIARPLYVDRYVLYGEAAAALLAGAGLYRIGTWLASTALGGRSAAGRNALIWVPGIVVCVATLVLQIAPQQRVRTPGSRMFNFGAPSQYIDAHAQPGDGVLFFGPFFRKARLGYPADYRDLRDFAMAESPEAAGTFAGTDQAPAAVAPLMRDYRRIWVVGNAPSTGLAAKRLAQESGQLMHDFTLAAKRHWKGVSVTLWVRR
jgi:mannosyltransferase